MDHPWMGILSGDGGLEYVIKKEKHIVTDNKGSVSGLLLPDVT